MPHSHPGLGTESGHDPGSHKHSAVILSGGGAAGAYEVGILKALVNGKSPATGYRPLSPDIFVGTSVGGFNAAFLVSQWSQYGAAAVSNLETFWLEELAGSPQDNGVYRVRVNPLDVLDPLDAFDQPLRRLRDLVTDVNALFVDGVERGLQLISGGDRSLERRLVELFDLTSFISTEPLRRTLTKLDYNAIRRSRRWLKIAATNWSTGELRVFWNHDFSDQFGPEALRASAAIPSLFPPVTFGSQLLADGSVLLNTPLSPAIHAGADELHVVYLDPTIKMIPIPKVSNTLDTLFRTQQIQWGRAYEDDISDAARINRALGALDRLEQGAVLDVEDVTQLAAESFASVRDRYRPLTIRRYRPAQPLGGGLGLLDFSRDNVRELIERGFQDAIFHDAVEAGDIFPDGVEPPHDPRDLTLPHEHDDSIHEESRHG